MAEILQWFAAFKTLNPPTIILWIVFMIAAAYQIYSGRANKSTAIQIRKYAAELQTVRKQMERFEDLFECLHQEFCLVCDRHSVAPGHMRDAFDLIFIHCILVVKNRVRTFCRQNHFAIKTDGEFKSYINDRVEILTAVFRQALLLRGKTHPEYETLLAIIRDLSDHMVAMLVEFFNDARTIAIEQKNAVEKECATLTGRRAK